MMKQPGFEVETELGAIPGVAAPSAFEEGAALGASDLSGCTIYTSCEPCPMCLGAIYWARISEVWYASGREDAEAAGFDDSLIYEEMSKGIGDRKLKMVQLEEPAAEELFRKWIEKPDKERY